MMQSASSTVPPATATTTPRPAPAPAVALTLRPSTSPSSGFTYPSLYAFPPFFTRQPHPQTYAHQLSAWRTLVLAHARHTRTFRLDLSPAQCSREPFRNPALPRQLPLPFLTTLVTHLVSLRDAVWVDPARPGTTAVWLLWHRPEEWAARIHEWVHQTGQLGAVLTLYELTEGGDLAHTTEFYRLPDPILRKALDVLVKQGKAQIFKGLGGEDGDGVKFVA